jgi:hypothetical protein
MQELRFVAVSEDGRYAVLAVPGRSARFTLPIDERLRAVALGQTSRLVQYEIEVESPLRPKEIQARIRAGETVEEIADAAGIAVERVRWFEGPVLAERAYVADQAQAASVRRHGDATPATPGQRLGEIVTERLKALGSDPEDAQWDAKKRGDGSWQVQLTFISAGRLHVAEWVFDPRRRHVLPADDNAARMSLPGTELPQPAAPMPGEATITQLAPRLTASGQGFGHSGAGTSGFSPAGLTNGGLSNSGIGSGGPGNGGIGNGGRARHERPGSVRPAAAEAAPAAPLAPAAPAASVADPRGDVAHEPAAGRHSQPQPTSHEPAQEPSFVREHSERDDYAPEPAYAEPEAPQAPVPAPVVTAPVAPASVVTASSSPATPPVTPATVAAQVSKAPQPTPAPAPQQARAPQQAPRPQPTRRAQEPARTQEPARAQEARAVRAPETAVPASTREKAAPAARQERPTPGTAAPAVPAAPAASAGGIKPAPADSAEPASEQAGRQSRKAARGKRSSVPSWDEIMFGNTRQRD